MKAGLKGRDRNQPSRSRGLSTRGRGTYAEDKLPVFVLADRSSGEQHVIPTKAATESTIRLLLDNRRQESMIVYTDGFRAHGPLEEDDVFTSECVVHGDGEYIYEDVHVNTCESHIEASLKTESHRLSERFSSAVKYSENRGEKCSKPSSKLRYDSPTIYATRAFTLFTVHREDRLCGQHAWE